MDVARILKPGSVRCEAGVGSKKLALDYLSQTLAEAAGELSASDVLEELAARERLGSTALGHAVAMPHARMAGIAESVGAFLRLSDAVDFGSADGQPVDLLFGVLVPEACSEEQLDEIRELIRRLGDQTLQAQLRSTDDPAELYELLTASLTVIHRRPPCDTPGPCA